MTLVKSRPGHPATGSENQGLVRRFLILIAAFNLLLGLKGDNRFPLPSDTAEFFVQLYMLPLTYLPGLWLSYLPAALIGFDPRYLSLVYYLASFALLSRFTRPRREMGWLAALALLNPYILYRHEVYSPVIVLLVVLATLTALHDSNRTNAFVLGLGCATQQFFWILAPLFWLHQVKKHGWLQAAAHA
ncbi:MAG: hypothetical protein AB1641_30455 [Thermodesulfobacteriota bacterium]